MTSLEEEIVAWATSRPVWQRNVLAMLARGEEMDETAIEQMAVAIIDDAVELTTPVLELADLPSGSESADAVSLVSIGSLAGVNALLPGQTLTFGRQGMTVVYGDNGSGKSGYARLVKDIVGARHRERILPNAYKNKPSTPQSAVIVVDIAGEPVELSWPRIDDPRLLQVSFYDEACGDDYLASETELNYRPSVITLFDRLIQVADRIRAAVDVRIASNKAARPVLPMLGPDTPAAAFLTSITYRTGEAELDRFLQLEADEKEQLAALMQEEARLKGTDLTKEKARLTAGASLLKKLADHIDLIRSALAPEAAASVVAQQSAARDLRTAATLASKESFAAEPLEGVGGETWRALWGAAQRFSESEAYKGRDFPATAEGDRCVLCQQPLAGDSRERMRRFHSFVHNDVATQAREAETKFSASLKTVEQLSVSSVDATAAMTFLLANNRDLAKESREFLEAAQAAKDRLASRLRGESEDPFVVLPAFDSMSLRTRAESVESQASVIDDAAFRVALADVAHRARAKADLIDLHDHRSALLAEIERLKAAERLRVVRSSLATTSMTAKSTELTRKYVTQTVSNWFIRESDRLKLDHVVLGDKGGSKGRLKHKPALDGAQGHSPTEVLSEGEQTAAGLAGLFTEVHFDESRSAIVLDDPVSSLDHSRRAHAAERVATISTERQVIVFTHDLTFLGDLIKAAEEAGVLLTERTIERDGDGKPGRVIEGYPWKAKDAKKRLNELREDLAKIKKGRAGWTSREDEMYTSDWAGRLSETWERFVRSEVANRIVDRSLDEVRPKMFKLVARITEDDDREFQAGYSVVSGWARRHDKSEERNWVSPTVDEMSKELDRAAAWYKRIISYQ